MVGFPSESELEQQSLDGVLDTVRKLVPGATALHLQTSDQAYYGFTLSEVLVSGVPLSEADAGLFDRVSDATSDDLYDLAWDGVVGEDDHGAAELDLDQEQ